MTTSSIIALLNNTALLLALGVIYDTLVVRPNGDRTIMEQFLTGLLIGAFGIAVMSSHFQVVEGVVFDCRTVLISLSGLFFGWLPTLIAVAATIGYRLQMGGVGIWAGVLAIALSGGIGLTWRRFRKKNAHPISFGELLLFGLIIQVMALLCLFLIPMPTPLDVIPGIMAPMLLIFPLGTALLGRLLVGREIRRRASEDLINSESRFQSAFEQSAVGMAHLKMSGRFIRMNQRFCDIMGYSRDELMEKTMLDITFPADVEPTCKLVGQALQDPGKDIFIESRFIRKDGSEVWGKLSSSVVRDNTGTPKYFSVVVEDISENKRKDEALRDALILSHRSEREMESLFKATRSIPEAFRFETAAETIFRQCKEHVGATCGYVVLLSNDYSNNSVVLLDEGAGVCEVDVDLPVPVRGLRGESFDRGEAVIDNRFVEGPWLRFLPQGHVQLENVLISPMMFGATPVGFIGLANKPGGFTESDKRICTSFGEIMAVALRFCRDREALAVSEQRMSAIVNAMPALLIAFDEKGAIIFWNAESERVTGYPADEVINHPEILEKFFPDPVYLRIVREGFTRQSKQITAMEYDIVCRDGAKRSFAWSNISGLAPIPGWASWAMGIDVTARKKVEKEKEHLEARILQLQKTEAIAALAGGIAHDFNNILYPILGFAELIKEDLPPGSNLHVNVDEIISGAKRAGQLVKQILTFSRQTNQERMPINPESIIKEAVKFARSTLPKTIAIDQLIDPNAHMIMADPTQIHQVVMHLITNAYHAMQELGGTLKVTLKNVHVEKPDIDSPELEPGPHVVLSVSDTGVGISRVILDRIFDPYFSTKPKDKGTGLGLSVVFGIVKSYRGKIDVQSVVGEGTTVNVYFPAVRFEMDSERLNVTSPLMGNERIMLVEDEEQILRLEKQMLERLGYQVTAFTDGMEALRVFQADPSAFDLVITDMTMPKMTGERLNQELVMIRRDVPVILCTGFSEQMTHEKADAFGIKGYLMKPIEKSELCLTVRKVLDEARMSA